MSAFPVVTKPAFVFRDSTVKNMDTAILYKDTRPFLLNAIVNANQGHYLSMKRHAYASRPKVSIQLAAHKTSLAVQTVHECFSGHVPLSLSPELIWYMIVHEVATHVKLNPHLYVELFNGNLEQKKVLTVRDNSLMYGQSNDWGATINLFRKPLEEELGEKMVELFLPQFTTSTEESDIALLVTFMDTASPYYEFEVETMCGIPEIRLEGEVADWGKLVDQANALSSVFPRLIGYFRGLLPVLAEIHGNASGSRNNNTFWRSIYKYQNESGGPFISGWINALFAHEWSEDSIKLKKDFGWNPSYETYMKPYKFPSHISQVAFNWNYMGTIIPMIFAAGVFGTWYYKPYLSPRLGYGVFELK